MSSSLKAINVLLLDYIVAIYPLFLTVVFYFCIEICDRSTRLMLLCRSPMTKCCHKAWNPKRTILKTFVTFFLLSYSKLFFVSMDLLLAARSYNIRGEPVPNSTVLLYDPTIRFFHTEHIPYATIALFVLLAFNNLLPPLLLLLYL